ncbi:hypothetical protein GCM10017581_095140 [Dactylosporangium matsuzakiense]|uniref:Uncharacterized protein n=1 Tax=Dactylosporangium matsuzakiense TaxID=53360 RepID=A0A9W6KTE7_9ACTN|nr:hypothetical protein GCM10017581_095140 [Dactylosporangium matsuzakiense]
MSLTARYDQIEFVIDAALAHLFLRASAKRHEVAQTCPYPRAWFGACDGAVQRARFVARLRGGVNSSAIAAIADGTRR